MPKKWIQKAIPKSHKGRLHKALGVPADKKIPAKTLNKAEHSSKKNVAKMANLAKTLRGLRK